LKSIYNVALNLVMDMDEIEGEEPTLNSHFMSNSYFLL